MTNRVLLGQDGSEYVLKVSRAGVDVTTASDEELIFDSTQAEGALPLLQGSISVTTDANGGATSSWVSYGSTFSYFPVVLATRVTGSSIVQVPEVDSQQTAASRGDKSNPDTQFRTEEVTRTYLEIEKSQFRIIILDELSYFNLYRTSNIEPSTTYTFYYNVLAAGGAPLS